MTSSIWAASAGSTDAGGLVGWLGPVLGVSVAPGDAVGGVLGSDVGDGLAGVPDGAGVAVGARDGWEVWVGSGETLTHPTAMAQVSASMAAVIRAPEFKGVMGAL